MRARQRLRRAFTQWTLRTSVGWIADEVILKGLQDAYVNGSVNNCNCRKAEKLTVVMEDPDNASLDDDGNDGASSCSDMGHDDVLPESIEADEEIRLHILGLSSYYTSVIECNFGAKISLLPTRYLPPGSIRLLYWQFRVVGSGCSYLHFWRVFREGWHNVLRFQSPSNHGQCDDCADYKESFGRSAQADSDQHRYEVARAYKDHITAVGRDRELETFLQSQRPLARQGKRRRRRSDADEPSTLGTDGEDELFGAHPEEEREIRFPTVEQQMAFEKLCRDPFRDGAPRRAAPRRSKR
ncbi:unnamed protein product [Durusdinium trenchii]|uniref:Histone acetyltransferase n=1 Tax=Durusdinium trenchii TaxID=1381693 RepID=A0ABP0Q1Y6_9DINO